MNRCWGYARVSTRGQFEDANSIAIQSDALIAFAQQRNLDLGETVERDFGSNGSRVTRERVFFESGSASKRFFRKREQGAALFAACSRGDTVLFPNMDRFSRNTVDILTTLEAFCKLGASVYFVDNPSVDAGSPDGLFLITVQAALAARESAKLGIRMKDVHALRRSQGRVMGFDERVMCRAEKRDGMMVFVPDPDQREHARLFWHMHHVEGISRREIERWADTTGLRVPAHNGYIQGKFGDRYNRRRIGNMIDAESALRKLAVEMGLPDDDCRVFECWARSSAQVGAASQRSASQSRHGHQAEPVERVPGAGVDAGDGNGSRRLVPRR